MPGLPEGEEGIFGGAMPSGEGQAILEMHGMAPIPEDNRYGRLHRVFTVWFTPNLVPSAFFIGTLATASYIGLGFELGAIAIVLGTLIAGVLLAYLCTWGPKTGVGQLPLARLPFGKTVIVPGILQWASCTAWDAINGIFGAEALNILVHLPFWLGLAIILIIQGLVGLWGYEIVQTVEKWMSIVLGVMFVIITVKIIGVGHFGTPNAVHGGPLVGGFLLMTTISASFVVPWIAYASDYSRYMKPDTSSAKVFWLTLAGVSTSCIWIEILGLAAATVIKDDTSAGIQKLVGGGIIGVIALIAIATGTVTVNAVNDYSGSLALQATGARIKRPWVAVVVTIVAFLLTLWLHSGGDFATKFTNVLLFITYWIPPFVAVQIIDWRRRAGRPNVLHLVRQDLLRPGWDALAAMLLGFVVAIPFMDTSLYIGWASSHWLQYGDIAYLVGFVVAFAAYVPLRYAVTKSWREVDDAAAGVGPATAGPTPAAAGGPGALAAAPAEES